MGSGGVHIREVPLYTCTIVTMYHTVSGKLDIKNDVAVGKVLVE